MADAPRGAAAPIPSAALAASPTTTSTAPAPHDLLQQLAGWMSASGYGADHPWQVAIAATLAAFAAGSSEAGPDTSGRRIGDELFDVHALLLATRARVIQFQDEDIISLDTGNELDRLVSLAAREVERLACGGAA